jgi:hypothetical protein
VFFLLLAADEQQFARKLSSFDTSATEIVIVFDASLTGVGFLRYRVTASGDEVLVGGSAVDLSSLVFGGDSSNQNTAEFIAALLTPWH